MSDEVSDKTNDVSSQAVIAPPEASQSVTEPMTASVELVDACQQAIDEVSKYEWDVRTAVAVMHAESGCDPSAYNPANTDGTNDAGLFQINSIHVDSGLIGSDERFDIVANVRAAFAIYRGSGWRAWSAYNAGKHLKFM